MITLTFAKPAELMNLNDRQHHMTKNKLSQAWKDAAYYAGVAHRNARRKMPPTDGLIGVRCTLPVKRVSARRDAHNFVATIKPILDGLTLAKFWPDDDTKHVALFDSKFQDEDDLVRVEFWELKARPT